jgi:LPS-assembly lipoprotein
MWSLEGHAVGAFARRMKIVLGAASLVGVTLLGGCGFQPLYGPTASGAYLSDVMRTVDISIIPGRVGQRIRNELIFVSTGGGEQAQPKYRLDIAVRESILNSAVEDDGEATSQIYQLFTQFKLIRLADNKVVLEGSNNARAAYDKADSVFADVRAKRDAEDRSARTISEAIRTRVAAYFSANA